MSEGITFVANLDINFDDIAANIEGDLGDFFNSVEVPQIDLGDFKDELGDIFGDIGQYGEEVGEQIYAALGGVFENAYEFVT